MTGEEEANARRALHDGLHWRLLGPFRGGRVVAVAGDPGDRLTFYFGSTGGGVWKTVDAGRSWSNVSDGYFGRASVGALAVAPADPNVIYAGMGESCIRSNVAEGDGVYRSTDAGATWTHLGLAETRHISRVRVHPHDPDRVYVAAFGHAFGPNDERGVYRSRDGGRTWDLVLHRDRDTGAADLAMDPHNPRVLYASMWQARRQPWTLTSGGPGSGLWRSADGGETWTDLSTRPGFPKGPLGRIGVCVSPARRGRIWAIVEAGEGAVLRSDDGGEHWDRLSEQGELRWRAWYYSHVFADPVDPDTVWALNIDVWKSIDGGRTFEMVPVPHGDAHDLWIDPSDPSRLILGDDGGANVSLDGGRTWSSLYNQPTAELYHVTTDTRTPYRVYAAQQDNTTICVPSHSELGVIGPRDAYDVGGGESGYIAVRPDDPDIVYAGSYLGHITRYDHRRRSSRAIPVWPESAIGGGADQARYRFNWTSPILLSPHDPDVLYQAGNQVFRSDDEGHTWRPISPDLTRAEADKLVSSGGEITPDNTGAEYVCTVFALAESPVQAGVLWAGTDDGLVHVSRDGGGTWQDVTPPDMAEWTCVSVIEPSWGEAGTAYVVGDRHRLDDFRPYLWRTKDYGSSWERLDGPLAEDELCRAIREDPTNPSLLYLGTERGVQVSEDAGASWSKLGGNLPLTPVHDLVVKGDDLVVATHGRSIWVLEDLPALREQATRQPTGEVFLYQPKRLVRYPSKARLKPELPPGVRHYTLPGVAVIAFEVERDEETGAARPLPVGAAPNAPRVTVLYWLPDGTEGPLTLTFSDRAGRVIRTVRSKTEGDGRKGPGPGEPLAPCHPGLNRFEWDTRHERGPVIERDPPTERGIPDQAGPAVPPGTYEVSLEVGGRQARASFEILEDPRNPASADDLQAQYELALRVWEGTCRLNRCVNTIRDLKEQLERWSSADGSPEEAAARASSLANALTEIERELVPVKPKGSVRLSYPACLDGKLQALFQMVDVAARPTASEQAVADQLLASLEDASQRLGRLVEEDLADLNRLLDEGGVKAVNVPQDERKV